MKIFKRLVCLIIMFSMLSSLASCGENKEKSEKLKIVCTVFPIYDWVSEIAADKADIVWLLKNGTDMHSFQPSASDMIKIAECDAIIYVGGNSDEWLNDAIDMYDNKKRSELKLMGLPSSNVYCENHSDHHEHHHHNHDEYDEHIWLSIKNAVCYTDNIASLLAEKDPKNAEFYKNNSEKYKGKLNELDKAYTETVNTADFKTLIFADRFPFRYLTEDYGISHFAAFPGCSAETEASFETIAFLSQKTDEVGTDYLLTTETASIKIADTIIKSTKEKNQKILTLNSMQSVTVKQERNGISYIKIAEDNLKILKKALRRV